MSVATILHWEGTFFLWLLTAMVVFKLLTRKIPLDGLFAQKTADGAQVSAERIQLLIATLAVSGKYLGDALHGTNTASLPDVNQHMLYVFGGSSGLYASIKAFTTLRK
jgi:hypothetical protein